MEENVKSVEKNEKYESIRKAASDYMQMDEFGKGWLVGRWFAMQERKDEAPAGDGKAAAV